MRSPDTRAQAVEEATAPPAQGWNVIPHPPAWVAASAAMAALRGPPTRPSPLMPAAPRVANAPADEALQPAGAAAPGRKRRARPWAEEEAAAVEAWRENGGGAFPPLPGGLTSSGVLLRSAAGGVASPAGSVVVHLDPTGLSPLDDSQQSHARTGAAGGASSGSGGCGGGSGVESSDAADLVALVRLMNGHKRRRTAGGRRRRAAAVASGAGAQW
jgi:hypothetical protein